MTSARLATCWSRRERRPTGPGTPRGLAQALNGLGMVAHHENLGGLISGSAPAQPDVAAEEQLFRAALAQAQQAGHAAATAQSLFGLGLVFQVLRRDWMTAMPYYWQALGLVTAPDTQAGPYLRSEVHRHLGFYFGYEDVQPAEARAAPADIARPARGSR